MTWKKLGWGLVLTVLVLPVGVLVFRPAAEAQQPSSPAAAGAKYSVVDTEGTNLLVVDNSTNTLYFYTVDPGKEVGDDLHLRGSLDLKDVGKSVLRPRKMAK
jgi:hypothetical protein